MVDVAELELRMRPGAWSLGGFLGEAESLSEVLATDAHTVNQLGVTGRELADSLSLLIAAPTAGLPSEDPEIRARMVEHYPSWEADAEALRARLQQRFGVIEDANLTTAGVGGRYEIKIVQYLGIQGCPWDRTDCEKGSAEWRIRHTALDLELSGPSLITHLIAAHGFFEGFESPYRVDPRALAELLELGPFSADQVLG